MNLKRESFLESFESLCNRPKLYTYNGTFYEVLAFIQGLALGSNAHGFAGSHAGIRDFLNWLKEKIGRNSNFDDSIEIFRNMYPDDETALKDFALFYREFIESLPEEDEVISIEIKESSANILLEYLSRCIESDKGSQAFSEIQKEIKFELDRDFNTR